MIRPGRVVPPYNAPSADVAQLVEHFTRNEGVSGSIPLVGSSRLVRDTKIQRRRRKIIESVDLPSLGIDLTNEELLQGVRKEQKKDLEEIRE